MMQNPPNQFEFVPEHLNALMAAIPNPGAWPGAQAPADWVVSSNLPPDTIPPAIHAYQIPFTRNQLRALCQNPNTDVLVGYLCTMAWGRQKVFHAPVAWDNRNEFEERLQQLRNNNLNREEAFSLFADHPIPRLGVAYFTKLLFFFSQAPDHYILDQWTARSVNLLLPEPLIPMHNHVYVRPDTTAEQYATYCEVIEALADALGQTPDFTERLLLSQGGHNPAPWRAYVREHG